MYEERIMAANKFVPQANRSLRSYNMYLNVRTSPRRSWIYRIPLISRIFSKSNSSNGESGKTRLIRPPGGGIAEKVPVKSNTSSNGKASISIPPRTSSTTSNSQSTLNFNHSQVALGESISRPTSPTHRSPIPPIPPSNNPRGELIFSSKVKPDFREGYEKYRAAFERRREERKTLESRGKWKWIPWFLKWREENSTTSTSNANANTSSGGTTRARTGVRRTIGEDGTVRERTTSGVRNTTRRIGNGPVSGNSTIKRPQNRNRSASQTSINSIASNLSQQSQTSVNSLESIGGSRASQSEASEEEEVEELDDLSSDNANQSHQTQSRINASSVSNNTTKTSSTSSSNSTSTGLPQEGLRVDTTPRPDLIDSTNSLQQDRRGRGRSSLEFGIDKGDNFEEDDRRGRERTPSPMNALNSTSSSSSSSSLGRRASSRSKSFRGASSRNPNLSRTSSTTSKSNPNSTASSSENNTDNENSGLSPGLVRVAGSSHDPNLNAVAATLDDRSDAELTLREPEPEPELEVEKEEESKSQVRRKEEKNMSEEWIEVKRSGRRSANHSSSG